MVTTTRKANRSRPGKALPIPNISPSVLIQVIDKATDKWKTLAECVDSQKRIREAVDRLRKEGYAGRIFWVRDCTGRYPYNG